MAVEELASAFGPVGAFGGAVSPNGFLADSAELSVVEGPGVSVWIFPKCVLRLCCSTLRPGIGVGGTYVLSQAVTSLSTYSYLSSRGSTSSAQGFDTIRSNLVREALVVLAEPIGSERSGVVMGALVALGETVGSLSISKPSAFINLLSGVLGVLNLRGERVSLPFVLGAIGVLNEGLLSGIWLEP